MKLKFLMLAVSAALVLTACSNAEEVVETEETVVEEETEDHSLEIAEDIPEITSQWYSYSTSAASVGEVIEYEYHPKEIEMAEDSIEYKGEGYFVLTDKNFENWRTNEVCDKIYIEDGMIIENSQERVILRLQSLSQTIDIQLLPTLDEDLGGIEVGNILTLYGEVDDYSTDPVTITVDYIYKEPPISGGNAVITFNPSDDKPI